MTESQAPPATAVPASLARLVDRLPGPLALVSISLLAQSGAGVSEHATLLSAEDAREGWKSVVIAAADLGELRELVGLPDRLAALGKTRQIAVWVGDADTDLVPRLRPEWPSVRGVDAHPTEDGGALVHLRFGAPVSAAEVLAEIGALAGRTTFGRGGLVVRARADDTATVPADYVLSGAADSAPNPVTGRAARPVPTPAPVDEGVFNPIGFRRQWQRDVVDLPPGPVTPAVVASLRDAAAVRVPHDLPERDATALNLAGVLSVHADVPAEWSDPLRREEESVRRRRAALQTRSGLAWRTGAADGLRVAGLPTVSIVLATRREDMLPFALRQVAKQAPAEVVIAAHGFEPDPAYVRDLVGDRPHLLLPRPADELFGDVLQAATRAASGDVILKMDDDDWYGPDVVSDLVWARRYSGATLVGMPAEFVYLEPLGITVRRPGRTETYGSVVAGGTMMIGRDDMLGLGGWKRVSRHVDAHLLSAVKEAGGTTYRAHGLGYVLRRTAGGHTWDPGLAYFLNSARVSAQWRGFVPSRLLTYDPTERPTVAA